MMCHRIGRPPIGIIGLGMSSATSRMRVPCPPQRITICMASPSPGTRRKDGLYPAAEAGVKVGSWRCMGIKRDGARARNVNEAVELVMTRVVWVVAWRMSLHRNHLVGGQRSWVPAYEYLGVDFLNNYLASRHWIN